MTTSKTPLDLRQMAYQVMLANGFHPDLDHESEAQLSQLEALATDDGKQPLSTNEIDAAGISDMRHLLWSSIDNADSKDLDQIEYCEAVAGSDDIRLFVGIADVDCYIKQSSALDKHAAQNCTSVYTGVKVFPMLPELLSNDLSSLMQDVDRRAIVVEALIGSEGQTKDFKLHVAWVRNQAKLAYDSVPAWLEHGADLPILSHVEGLEAQLRLQNQLAERLQGRNQKKGALAVQTLEARPVAVEGQVVGLVLTQQNKARDLIQSFMVTANSALAKSVAAQGFPMIQRVVRKPERWNRIVALAKEYDFTLPVDPDAPALAQFIAERKQKDPEHFADLSLSIVKLLGPGVYLVHIPGQPSQGHFGLAVHDYTHATAPNRRFADLVTQRVTKAIVAGAPAPYTVEELQAICDRCENREEAARKVERTMRKAAAAMLLSSHIGETYEGIVTGVNSRGTFARLIDPPAEGRIVRNEQGLQVGDKVQLKLTATEPSLGFIDFARVSV